MTTPKVALITGITGQACAHLTEVLLDKPYPLHGIESSASPYNSDRSSKQGKDGQEKKKRVSLDLGNLVAPNCPRGELAENQSSEFNIREPRDVHSIARSLSLVKHSIELLSLVGNVGEEIC